MSQTLLENYFLNIDGHNFLSDRNEIESISSEKINNNNNNILYNN